MSEATIEDINKNKPHFVMMAVCLNPIWKANFLIPCHNRWVAVVPARTNTLQLECPACHGQDSFATIIPPSFSE